MTDSKISAINSGVTSTPTAGDLIPAARAGANIILDAGDLGGTATPSDFQPAIVTNSYYTSPLVLPVTYNNVGPGAGNYYAYPIWFSHTETWTRIAANVAVGTGSTSDKVRLAIWANGADNKPGAVLVDSGELSLETATEISATISQALTANTPYWIGLASNDLTGTATLQGAVASRALSSIFGSGSVADSCGSGTLASMGYFKAVAYGAVGAFGTPDGVSDALPAIWLRKV